MSHNVRSPRAAKRARGVVLDGDVLRALRHEQELTQEQLAESAGISTRSYQNAERGRRVSRRIGHRIAVAFGRPFTTFIKLSHTEMLRQLDEAGFAPLPPPPSWVSRDQELERVTTALRNDEAAGVRCCLSGPTGIGKTTLAQKAASDGAADFVASVVWVTASRNRSERDAVATMTHIAGALDFEHHLPPSEMVSFEAFRRSFLKRLFEQRRLLILDDVESVETGQRLLGDEALGWTLLTTTQRSVAAALGEVEVVIGPLTEAASLELLGAHLGADRVGEDPAASESLVRLMGGVPRNLLIATNVLRHERCTALGDYVCRVRALDQPELSGEEGRWLRSRDEASFGQAYAQLRRRLEDRSWAFFGALSVFGDALFSTRWAAAAAGASFTEAKHHLSVLVDAFLLREVPSGQAEGGSFSLDTQAHLAAAAIGMDSTSTAQRRLCRFALEEARRLGALDVAEGVRALTEEYQTWRRCFDLMSSMVRPSSPGEVLESPDERMAVESPLDALARMLPDVIVALGGALEDQRFSPEVGAWVSAALRVAHHEGERRLFGYLAALLGRWWGLNQMGFEQMWRFGEHAVEALSDQRGFEAAYRVQVDIASGQFIVGRHSSALRSFEGCLELARRGNLSPRYSSHSLGFLAFFLGYFAKSSEEWERAVSYCEQALARCPEQTPLDRMTRDSILFNLSVMRFLEGRRLNDGDLEAALRGLLEIAGDDQLLRWLLERTGRCLGLSVEARATKLTRRRQKEILLAVDVEALSSRIVKLCSMIYSYVGQIKLGAGVTEFGSVVNSFLSDRVALIGLGLGTRLEHELGYLLGLIYPSSILDELFDDCGTALTRLFIERTVGAGHPALEAIDLLEAFVARD